MTATINLAHEEVIEFTLEIEHIVRLAKARARKHLADEQHH